MRNLLIEGLKKPDGTVLAGVEFTVTLLDSLGNAVTAIDLDEPSMVTSSVTFTTDANGDAAVSLWPNEDGDIQNTYYGIKAAGYTSLDYVIWLPSGTEDIALATLIASGIASTAEHEEILYELIERLITPSVEAIEASVAQIDTNTDDIAGHTSDITNPHSVTAAQVGLSSVDNTADVDKPIQTAVKPYIGGTTERNTVLSGGLKLDTQSTKGFAATVYSGTGTAQSITTGVDMATGNNGGFVWIKDRTLAIGHRLTDTVRGINSQLFTQDSIVEQTSTNVVTEFNNSGFSLGNNAGVNTAGTDNIVAWSFQTTEKTTGTTSAGKPYTAHYNPAMGFSVIGAKASKALNYIPNIGLGGQPEIIISKSRTTASDWWVGRNISPEIEGNSAYWGISVLNTNASEFTTTNKYYSDGSGFSDRYSSANSSVLEDDDVIHYCFRSVPGFSKITTYVGTGAGGNVVDLGLDMTTASSFCMIKRLDSSGDWLMYDNVRDTDGNISKGLKANSSDIESEISTMTFTAIGITMNATVTGNVAGGQYLIMAFTSNYNRARPFFTGETNDDGDTLTGIPYVEAGTVVTHAEGFDENGAKDVIQTFLQQDVLYSTDAAKYVYGRKGVSAVYRTTGVPQNVVGLNIDTMTTLSGDVYLGEVKWMDGKAFAVEPAPRTSYTQQISDGTNTVTPAELRAKCDEPYVGVDGKLVSATAKINTVGVSFVNSFNIACVVYNSTGNYTVYFSESMAHANYGISITPNSSTSFVANVFGVTAESFSYVIRSLTNVGNDSAVHITVSGGN